MRRVKRSERKSVSLDALEEGRAELMQIVGYRGAVWIVSVDDSPPINDRTGDKVRNKDFRRVIGDYYFMHAGSLYCSNYPHGKPST